MNSKKHVPSQDPKVGDGRTQFRWKKISKPKKWRAEVENVKQRCWCGDEWHDNHEDADHEAIWVKVSTTPVLEKHKTT
jgi:hypothetical protein